MKSFRTNIKNFLPLPLSTLNADSKITKLLTNSSVIFTAVVNYGQRETPTSLQIIDCIKENICNELNISSKFLPSDYKLTYVQNIDVIK